jgi:serine/threonine protein phosphatase PrpC
MAERWFYTQGGRQRGPISAAELMHLAAAGKLAPTDLLWPEGADRSQAVTVESAVRPPAATAPAKEPDWLGDVKKSEKAAPPPPLAPRAGAPDWLEDVRRAEQSAPPPATSGEEATVEIIAPGRPPRLAVGAATSRGRVRDRNEDRYLVQQLAWSEAEHTRQVSLLIVADGMGGYQGGDEAAALVVRTVGRALGPVLLQALDGEDQEKALPRLAGAIDAALQEANDAVSQRAQQGAQLQGMGATAAVVLVWDDRALIGHVGDCRVYHHSADLLRQVTRDQTLVARMVELGQLSPREAARHPGRNEVTQAIGRRTRLEPGRAEVTLTRGDWLVVCCDGLYAHVTDAALEKAIGESLLAADLAHHLVLLADQGGGSDNCTVLAACYD